MTIPVVNSGTAIVLAEGTTISTIKSYGAKVLTTLNDCMKQADYTVIAFAVHLIGQEQFDIKANKGDISALKDWIEKLFDSSPDWARSHVSWLKDLLGFDMTVVLKDDDNPSLGYECRMELKDKRDLAQLKAGFNSKLMAAYTNGIIRDRAKYGKRTGAKRVKSPGKGGSSNDPSNVITIDPDIAAMEADGTLETAKAMSKSGIMDAIAAANADEELLSYLSQIAEVWSQHPNRKSLTDLLDSTVKKMRNGLNLKVAVNS